MITGGLFTILKVRDGVHSYDEDPGLVQTSAGTVALEATDEELRQDGIELSKAGRRRRCASDSREKRMVTPGTDRMICPAEVAHLAELCPNYRGKQVNKEKFEAKKRDLR